MRRLMIVFLCLFFLIGTVSAADQASSIQSTATVSSDGSCQVTMIASIHLDKGDSSLTFPLPLGAKQVQLNNSRVRCTYTDTAVEVPLDKVTGGAAGDFTLTFSYSLDNVVRTEEKIGQVLTLPILSGFSFPIEHLEFSVTLPGAFQSKPTFSSGYHQESIESSISYSVNGNTINGVLSDRLQDHETLAMRLQVPETLFPAAAVTVHHNTPYLIAMAGFMLLALIYWLLTLRTLPLKRIHCSVPPEGVTAGELGCRLSLQGADLTMMVLSWAQLGYLRISMDKNGRVFLHRRMDMGNERSAFENHYFHALFRKNRAVDGTGYRYAKLCKKASSENPSTRGGFKPSSGNPKLFLGLCAGAGAAVGAAIGNTLSHSDTLQLLLILAMGMASAVASWQIQKLTQFLHLRHIPVPWHSLVCIAVWLVLGLLTGQLAMVLIVIVFQLLAGLMAAYGGRRTEIGRQTAQEILGLRHYLKTVSADELKRILQSNPDYYYELAPYALALGVDKAFAARFGKLRQPSCPYLTTDRSTNHTALDWYPLLQETADVLNARQKHMKLEKILR